jgi:hypothetical protein
MITYDLPLTHVATLDEILADVLIPTVGLSAIKMAWAPPDANAPRIWAGAYNSADRLTLTGSPTAVDTPWVDSDGTRIAAEQHGAVNDGRRYTAAPIPVSAANDMVLVSVVRGLSAAAQNYFLATYDMVNGVLLYRAGGSVLLAFASDAGTLRQAVGADISTCFAVLIGVVQRGGNVGLYINGVASTPAAEPGGDATGGGISINGSTTGTNDNPAQHVVHVVATAAGIAAPFLADSAALIKRITSLLTATEPRSGGGFGAVSFSRATARSWYDGAGRLHLASAGLPCAGDAATGAASGLRIAPARTNKCYNTINPTATTGWTATGGTHSHSVDDSAALAAAKLEAVGPYVFSFVPGAGDQQVYGGAATATTDPHSLSCYLRGAAGGESVDLCLRDASTGALQMCGSVTLTTSWVRYLVHNVTPNDTDQVFCLDCDAGDTVYYTLPQLELGGRCSSPIPNWATAAAATRNADILDTPITPSDAQGAIECGVTPLYWSAADATGQLYTIERAGGVAALLYTAAAAGKWRAYDGTNALISTGPDPADGVRQQILRAWGPTQAIAVDGVRTETTYDGTLPASGVLRLTGITGVSVQAEVAVDTLRVYRRYR